jgi:glycosyltransferase involved in cell wall biosynthesis
MPRVSIGLPVYNGERFLRETLDSILAQTYRDFELIISDNGSTDGTQEICRAYAGRDPRIRYYREEINRGASWNYNRVVELAAGEYFKWAAHDDCLAPTFLARCVEGLDQHPHAVLCHPQDQDIDENGQPVDRKRFSHIPSGERAASPKPSQRFRRLIRLDYDVEQVFGVIRAAVLRKTVLIESYTDSDRTLIAELGLRGQFYEVPEPLFLHRHHAGSSGKAFTITRGWFERAAWFDPRLQGRVLFSQWKQLGEYVRCAWRAPLRLPERAACMFWLAVGYRQRVRPLAAELAGGIAMAFRRQRVRTP